ncbi:MAG: SDR family oxidoreductase, partial [Acidimicrobiia bacterium]|nr:SDR family oxidoreductase [Acidimicrobiia bacterium]
RASALALADEGCKVVVTARGEEALRQTEKELAERTEVLAITEDVTQPDAPKRLVEATVDRFGGVDILVPNAGGPPPTLALEFDDEQLAAALNANLITSIRLVREAVPHMCANKWGRICCITSSSIKQPIPTLAMSNVARTALWAWIKTAAQELFPDGITINTAAPGSHATDRMKQLGGGDTSGMGDPADFGKVVAFLCSQPANFITGAALQVDGGATVGLL